MVGWVVRVRRAKDARMMGWEAFGPTEYIDGEGVKGEDLCREQGTTLNRLRTGAGRYREAYWLRSFMTKWRLADSAACECGEPEQTSTDHIDSAAAHYT